MICVSVWLTNPGTVQAKRVAKIKSKAFRRIQRRAHKRAEDGQALSLDQMSELDALDDGNRVQGERVRLEVQRARERATLRHASKRAGGGRWARDLGGLHGLDEGAQTALVDRAVREEQLRRKILGRDNEDDSDNLDDVSEDDPGSDLEAIRRSAFDELASLERRDAIMTAEASSEPQGLLGMKFMQRGMAAEQQRVDALMDDFREELDELEHDDDEDAPKSQPTHARVNGNAGRFLFTPSAHVSGGFLFGMVCVWH